VKVLLFGWDGVPPRVVETAIESGYTPNLAELASGGARGVLVAEPPIVTPPNWYAALTGYRPSRHGVTNFVVIDTDYGLRYMSIRDLRVEGVWDILGRHGYRGLYLNIPVSTPAPRVNGLWIGQEQEFAGPGRPREENIYPVDRLGEIVDMGYQIGYPFYSGRPRDYYRRVMGLEEDRLRAMHSLIRSGDYDLQLYIAMTPDILMHVFLDDPGYMEYVYKCLSTLDRWLGRFMDILGMEASYIIHSDHGQRRKEGLIDLLTLLEEMGYLRTRRSRRIRAQWLRRNRLVRSIWRRIPTGLRRRLDRGINRVFILESPARELQTMVDWGGTSIFPLVNVGGLKANLRGVFREGSVDPERHVKLMEEVAQRLREARHQGRKLFKEVVTSPNPDPHIPDILLEPDETLWFASRGTGSIVFKPSQPSLGEVDDLSAIRISPSFHIREGFYVFGGAGFKKGGDRISIMDIAPTILYLIGAPIPRDMDGKLHINLISDDLLRERKPVYTAGAKNLRQKLVSTRKRIERLRRKGQA